jgi:hypothetical protein
LGVGVGVGGSILLAVIVLLAVYLCKKHNDRR